MTRSAKRIPAVIAGLLALALISYYCLLVYELSKDDPVSLLGCVQGCKSFGAWTSKQILRYASLTPEQVRELNEQGGAAFPARLRKPADAEEMLSLFLARGVDINARSRLAHDWTALHLAASGGEVAVAELLLKHGARVDVRDRDGKTPLDVARGAREKFVNNPNHEEMLRLLETVQQPAPAR
jgi:Ankyrin repeats (3 copies)